MGVSLNGGTPKSSILIGFSIINHPFWGTSIFGSIHIFGGCFKIGQLLDIDKKGAKELGMMLGLAVFSYIKKLFVEPSSPQNP